MMDAGCKFRVGQKRDGCRLRFAEMDRVMWYSTSTRVTSAGEFLGETTVKMKSEQLGPLERINRLADMMEIFGIEPGEISLSFSEPRDYSIKDKGIGKHLQLFPRMNLKINDIRGLATASQKFSSRAIHLSKSPPTEGVPFGVTQKNFPFVTQDLASTKKAEKGFLPKLITEKQVQKTKPTAMDRVDEQMGLVFSQTERENAWNYQKPDVRDMVSPLINLRLSDLGTKRTDVSKHINEKFQKSQNLYNADDLIAIKSMKRKSKNCGFEKRKKEPIEQLSSIKVSSENMMAWEMLKRRKLLKPSKYHRGISRDSRRSSQNKMAVDLQRNECPSPLQTTISDKPNKERFIAVYLHNSTCRQAMKDRFRAREKARRIHVTWGQRYHKRYHWKKI